MKNFTEEEKNQLLQADSLTIFTADLKFLENMLSELSKKNSDFVDSFNQFSNAKKNFTEILNSQKQIPESEEEIIPLALLFNKLSENDKQIIYSAVDFSLDLCTQESKTDEFIKKVFFKTGLITNKLMNILEKIENSNFAELIYEILKIEYSRLTENTVFLNSISEQQNKFNFKNPKNISSVYEFYKSLNKIEQTFFTETILPDYILYLNIQFYTKSKNDEKFDSSEEAEEIDKKVTLAQQILLEIFEQEF